MRGEAACQRILILRCFYGMEAYLVDDLKGMVTNPKKTVPGRKIRGFRH